MEYALFEGGQFVETGSKDEIEDYLKDRIEAGNSKDAYEVYELVEAIFEVESTVTVVIN